MKLIKVTLVKINFIDGYGVIVVIMAAMQSILAIVSSFFFKYSYM